MARELVTRLGLLLPAKAVPSSHDAAGCEMIFQLLCGSLHCTALWSLQDERYVHQHFGGLFPIIGLVLTLPQPLTYPSFSTKPFSLFQLCSVVPSQ